jgi:hypothetical protein
MCAEHSREDILADFDLTTARKGKTMTKHMTGDSEVERDLRKMKPAPQALTERTMTDFMRDELDRGANTADDFAQVGEWRQP